MFKTEPDIRLIKPKIEVSGQTVIDTCTKFSENLFVSFGDVKYRPT